MQTITLQIDCGDEQQTVSLENELSIGRSPQASLALPDSGLSRVNTTFFREGNEVLVVDENSTNGTFINGERIAPRPIVLKHNDLVSLGNFTKIRVSIGTARASTPIETAPVSAKPTATSAKQNSPASANTIKSLPIIPIVAGGSTFAIILIALAAILIVNSSESTSTVKPTAQIRSDVLIPVRVIDPLGGEDPEDLDDLIAILEQDIADDVKDSTSFDEVKAVEPGGKVENENGLNLNVPISFWESQKALAMGARDAPTGSDPPGQEIPAEIGGGGGVPKQKAKLAEMKAAGYRQPMDFADLAQKRLDGELIELPMASETFVLDVGGSASEGEFVGFDFARFKGNFNDCFFPLTPGTPKYEAIAKLANNFEGQKYDLSNPRHRKQIRIRLLRMFNKRALPILQELAGAYFKEFKRPLRVTSLNRSMDYQISLNKNNANSFVVRGPDSLPPHTSGCAFDLARKQMTAKEQNFVMKKLAEMEKRGILDGLREGGVNSCFHVFVYHDGVKPKGF